MNFVQIENTGYKFGLTDPATLNIVGSVPHAIYLRALDAVNSIANDKHAIDGNHDLSSIGRANKLAPIVDRAWASLVAAYVALAALNAGTDSREAALFALPKLDPTASAVAQEDIEARTWYRAQTDEKRYAVMKGMADNESDGAKYFRLQIALLRSPVPLPDTEQDFFSKLWKQTQRVKNVGEAMAIEGERNAAEWSASALGHLYGALSQLTQWPMSKVIGFIAADESRLTAAPAMGISARDLAFAIASLKPIHATRRMS